MRSWLKVTKPQVPSPRARPSDLSIAQLVAEANLIIAEINEVAGLMAEALREGVDHA